MIGRQLLHYRIEERLGAGAMGEVYRARDDRLGRDVAIKVLPKDREVDEARFQHEARSLAALNHPHIVTLHAIEEVDEERFLVMELIDGEGLDERIPAEGLAEADLLDLAIPLVGAVSAAHQRGILHRDLKPTNVMVGEEGRLKILDFGLAKPLRQQPQEDDATRTNAAAVSGTVPYMAPEILRGARPDGRSDLFSLGVMLFEMATGARPWTGGAPVEVLVSILEDPPRDLRALNPQVSAGLAAVIDRCLEKNPERRYAEAADLLTDLERVRDGRRLESTTLTSVVIRRIRHRRRGLLVIAALVLAITLGAVWQANRPVERVDDGQMTIAVLPFESLGPEAEAYFALGVTEEIIGRLATIRGLGIIARSSAEQLAQDEAKLEEIGRELGIDYVLEGSVRWSEAADGTSRVRVTPKLIDVAAGTQLWSTNYDRVLADLFTVQTDIARQVVDQLDLTLFPAEQRSLESPPTENLEAYQAFLAATELSGNYSDAEAQGEVIRLLERAVTLDPEFLDAWCQIAWIHAQYFHFGLDRSVARVESAKRALDRARQIDPSSPVVHLTEGYYQYWTQQNHEAALRSLRLAAHGLPGDVRIPETEGYVLRRQGRFEAALARLQAARELDPLDSNLHREIGGTLTFLRRYDEALAAYQRAKETTSEPILAYLYESRVHWLRGDLASARAALEAMPEEEDNTLPIWFTFWQEVYEGHFDAALDRLAASPEPFIRWTTQAIPLELLEAEIFLLQGDEAKARSAFADALVAVEAEILENPEDRRLNSSRAIALAGLGRGDEARAEMALVAETTSFTQDAVFYLDKRFELARLELLLGQEEKAVEILEELLDRPSMWSRDVLQIDPRWRGRVMPLPG